MNKIFITLAVFLAFTTSGYALQGTGTVEYGLDGVVKNGTVDTRVGPLTFENGYPSRHSV